MATEVKIPVPWGHIAGLAWGNQNRNSIPVLAIHGSMDNAATFSHLIPLLPQQHFYYLSIDLPGHGHSSHLPQGIPYHFTDHLLTIKRIINYFSWHKVILMSHSYGAFISIFFSALYPDVVKRLIMIDVVSPRLITPNATVCVLRYTDQRSIASKNQNEAPQYSSEEALLRLKMGRATTLTDAAVKTLLSRAVIKKGDKFSFSLDQRLKSAVHPVVTRSQVLEIYSNVKCPILIVVAEDTKHLLFRSHIIEVLNLLKCTSKSFQLVLVPGNHDVHLNNSQLVATPIHKFISQESMKSQL